MLAPPRTACSRWVREVVAPPPEFFLEIFNAKSRAWGQFRPENKLIEGQPNEYDVICRNASVLAFQLWPTIFAGCLLQSICRNGVPRRSRATTPLPVSVRPCVHAESSTADGSAGAVSEEPVLGQHGVASTRPASLLHPGHEVPRRRDAVRTGAPRGRARHALSRHRRDVDRREGEARAAQTDPAPARHQGPHQGPHVSRPAAVRPEVVASSCCMYMGGSVAGWLACWTQAQKGPGLNRSRNAVG